MISTQQALNWRYATKKFDATKKLTNEQLNLIIEAARMAPTSYGLQPVRLVVVEDPQIREQLKAASWNQDQITSASHLLVFTVVKDLSEKEVTDYINLIASERGIDVANLEGFKGMMMGALGSLTPEQKLAWVKKQAYITLGFALLTAAENEIDACPMEGFNPNEYDRILGLNEKGLTASVVLPVGYRALDDKDINNKKVRLPVDKFVV